MADGLVATAGPAELPQDAANDTRKASKKRKRIRPEAVYTAKLHGGRGTDSPTGLLAWIAEKFTEWTDPSSRVDRDQLLTNVSVYWFTRTANSAARLYAEFARSGSAWGKVEPSSVPAGVAQFPYEIFPPIRRFAEGSNNIVHWSEFDRGGHFPAMEQPDLLVGDIRAFFGAVR